MSQRDVPFSNANEHSLSERFDPSFDLFAPHTASGSLEAWAFDTIALTNQHTDNSHVEAMAIPPAETLRNTQQGQQVALPLEPTNTPAAARSQYPTNSAVAFQADSAFPLLDVSCQVRPAAARQPQGHHANPANPVHAPTGRVDPLGPSRKQLKRRLRRRGRALLQEAQQIASELAVLEELDAQERMQLQQGLPTQHCSSVPNESTVTGPSIVLPYGLAHTNQRTTDAEHAARDTCRGAEAGSAHGSQPHVPQFPGNLQFGSPDVPVAESPCANSQLHRASPQPASGAWGSMQPLATGTGVAEQQHATPSPAAPLPGNATAVAINGTQQPYIV